MARYSSYIICTSPRSGSTLLCKLLAATGKSGMPDSHFHAPSVSKWLGYWDLSREQFSSQRKALKAAFDAARAIGTGNTGIFGLRLQRHSCDYFFQQLAILHQNYANDKQRIEAAFSNTLFIHLTRENKLDQAISYIKATQSGLWHRAPDGTELERLSAPQIPFYDANAIAQQLARLTKFDEEWKAWFKKEKIEPVEITYEELSSRSAKTLAHILQAWEWNTN